MLDLLKTVLKNDLKLKYYYHITEKYIGSAQSKCNIFQNMQNYDSHLIFQKTWRI